MKKNQAERFLFMGVVGLHITIAIHILVILTTGISIGKSMAYFMGMYPTWVSFFVIGLVKIRREKREGLTVEE